MPSAEERKRRRTLVREIERQQQAADEQRMPISKDHLAALLQYLNAMLFSKGKDGTITCRCDHTLKLTCQFLGALRCWSEDVEEWLGEYGGYCDCEVAFNVGSTWESHLQGGE